MLTTSSFLAVPGFAGRPAPVARPAAEGNAAAGAIRFATITELATFTALGPEWNALFEEAGRPQQAFQGFEWLALWARIYLDRRTRLSVVTGRIDGRLVLVWPLVIERRCGIRILSCMGEPLSQYGDGLMADDLGCKAADAAFDHLLTLPVDILTFRRVREDAAMVPVLRRRAGPPTNHEDAPLLVFGPARDLASFEKRYSGKLRASRRRRWRRLAERGPLTVETPPPAAEAGRCAALAVRFKREWADRHGLMAPSIRDTRFERFFVEAASHARPGLDLRVMVMRSAGEIAAVALSLVAKGRLFGHVLAPRPGLEPFGLGGLMAEQTIHAALHEGLEAVDMIAPANPFKLEWTETSVGVDDYSVSRTVAGRLYGRAWLGFARPLAKRVAGRLGPWLRRSRPAA